MYRAKAPSNAARTSGRSASCLYYFRFRVFTREGVMTDYSHTLSLNVT